MIDYGFPCWQWMDMVHHVQSWRPWLTMVGHEEWEEHGLFNVDYGWPEMTMVDQGWLWFTIANKGCLWYKMVIVSDNIWPCMTMFEFIWPCLNTIELGQTWLTKVNMWLTIGLHGWSRLSMFTYRWLWLTIVDHNAHIYYGWPCSTMLSIFEHY